MPLSTSKSKRPVTACRECYRRKQKCDRQKPCNHCVSRKVPTRCVYPEEPGFEITRSSPNESLSHISSNECDDSNNSQAGLQHQMGYPLNPQANGFTGLQESVKSDDDFLSRHSRPPRDLTAFPTSTSLLDELPAIPAIKALVDVYFTEANWYLQFLTRPYFDSCFSHWQTTIDTPFGPMNSQPGKRETAPEEIKCFPAVLFQILAVSMQFISLETPAAKAMNLLTQDVLDRVGERFSNRGDELIAKLGRRKPSMAAIQHDMLKATFLKNSSRGAEAWYPLGTAIRQGQDMGLHLLSQTPRVEGESVEESLERFWFEEFKRRMWITLFIWDSHMSAALGRPRAINTTDCTTKKPLDCDFPSSPSTTVPFDGGSSGYPSTFICSMFVYDLSHKIHDAVSSGANKRFISDYSIVQRIDEEVRSLMANVPAVARPVNPDTSWDERVPNMPRVREVISSMGNAYLLWLHRPHAPVHTESRAAAVEAALDTLRSQQRWFELTSRHRYKLFTLSLYTFDASIFLVACLLRTKDKGRTDQLEREDEIHHEITNALKRLKLMRNNVPMARSAEAVLGRYWKKVREDKRGITGMEGPGEGEGLMVGRGVMRPVCESLIGEGTVDLGGYSGGSEGYSESNSANDSFEVRTTGESQYNSVPAMTLPSAPPEQDLDFNELGIDLPGGEEVFADITDPNYDAANWMNELSDGQLMMEHDAFWIH